MFLGTFNPKLLARDQVVLPAKIRSNLGNDRAILTTGFDKCIYGFSLEDWNKIAEQELIKPLSTLEGRKIRQVMFARALEVDFDDQGRFVIPGSLREYAGIASELTVIGAGDHFEIWNTEEWEKVKKGL